MGIPEITEKSIQQLHINYSKDPIFRGSRYLELIWGHSVFVSQIAMQLADAYQEKTGINLDKKIIEQGALVYKIGVYDSVIRGQGNSDIELPGSKILIREGFPLELAVFPLAISSPDYRAYVLQNLQIPGEYLVPTLEELLVGYADNYHNGSIGQPRFVGRREASRKMRKISRSAGERFEILEDEFGIPDLTALSEKSKVKEWHEKMTNYYAGLVLPNTLDKQS